jgi:hypothetical protein
MALSSSASASSFFSLELSFSSLDTKAANHFFPAIIGLFHYAYPDHPRQW